MFLLHYSRRTFGFTRTKNRRNIVAKLFPPKERRFSKLMHVHGELYDQIARSAQRDHDYFLSVTDEPSTNLFSIPRAYAEQRHMEDQLDVPDWWFKLIDRVITRKEIDLAFALKMKENMKRKAKET